MSKINKVSADLEYVNGYLRYGHIELELNDENFEKFKNSSKEEQEEWIKDEGELIIDSFEVNDRGDITSIEWGAD